MIRKAYTEAREAPQSDGGALRLGVPRPDYLLTDVEFGEPLRLVEVFPGDRPLYLYRVSPESTAQTARQGR